MSISVITPLGVPALSNVRRGGRPGARRARAERPARSAQVQTGLLCRRPCSARSTGPETSTVFAFEAKAGQQLVFQVVARSLGSQIAAVAVRCSIGRGHTLAQTNAGRLAARSRPDLHGARRRGRSTLQIADADYGGSGRPFLPDRRRRAAVSSQSVFPLGRRARPDRQDRNRRLEPRRSQGSRTSRGIDDALPARSSRCRSRSRAASNRSRQDGGRCRWAAVGRTGNQRHRGPMLKSWSSRAEPRVTSGTTGTSTSTDSGPGKASGSIVEVFGRRLGSPIDSIVEVLDATGRPIPRAVLRPVDQTEVAFRDHASKAREFVSHGGTTWPSMIFILFGRELARIQALPRNPDDDAIFWNQQGQRLGMLETTPEHHPMGQPMYKVEIHPPGTVFPPGGVPITTLTYMNDDGGPSFAKDSRVTFDAPGRRRLPGPRRGRPRSGWRRLRLSPGPATARPVVPDRPGHRESEHPARRRRRWFRST